MNKYREILNSWEVPGKKTTDQAWNDIQPRLSATKPQEARVISFSWRPLVSVAAAAAVIVAVVLVWPNSKLIQRETAARQIEAVMLPDQSMMILNAGSSASYDDDWSDSRTLELDGQAFFEVQKGSKFSVVTSSGVVEVLGTSFDVFSRGQDFRVSCTTGKVRVSSGKSNVEITPGNMAELSKGVLVISQFDPQQADWQSGEFTFTDEPLQNVFSEMQRQFNITITSPELKDRFYTGRFSNRDLAEALELVCLPMGLRYEIGNNNNVTITVQSR